MNKILGSKKTLFSLFCGSRISEINILLPILINFIKLMNDKYDDITYVFHSTKNHYTLIKSLIDSSGLTNCEVITDEQIKSHVLSKSIFAVSKSGTVSLEICNVQIPSIIIYKMSFLNFFIIKLLVKTKYANIINIAANKEIIPELLQSNCNANNIYEYVNNYLDNPRLIKDQILKTEEILKDLKTNRPPSELASLSLNKFLENFVN